ncbi:MAG TPA: response regulator transcription factor [Chitinophagaceae bacterium]|nr:response regulator transcription factor [Chitinophagaceae bacterium]
MLPESINVAIVEDHTLVRRLLNSYITEQRNMNVVLMSPDVHDLLRKLPSARAQVLVMDLFMPGLSGFEAVKILRDRFPDIKILILSMCTDMNLLSDLLELGVYGILSKAEEPEELVRAINSICEQRIYRSKLFTEAMYWNKQANIKAETDSTDILLNDREKRILELLWEEKSNKEIAGELFLSVRSIEKMRQDLKEKLGIKSTIGLLKYAINKKIIPMRAVAALTGAHHHG